MTQNEKNTQSNKLIPKKSSKLKLGDLFKRRREELRMSLESVERSTHIRVKYLEFIESGDYAHLEDNVYSQGYVKNYADHLGFDTKEILRLYNQERRAYDSAFSSKVVNRKKAGLRPIDSQAYTLTPKTFLIGIAAVFILGMASYIGWQLSKLSAPPVINLTNQDRSRANNSYVIVSGEVDSGSDVFINDSPILSTADGSFSDKVLLVEGTNQIKISARNKFGKESSKTIIVEAELKDLKDYNSTEVSKNKIDGVELQVTINNQATYVVIKADNKEVFKGTMLKGTKQLFKARENIKLTTGNAGNTSLRITNAVVVDKSLSNLGADGEIKQDIIITKETNIQ